MKLSKKCRYGLRALIDLAANYGNGYLVLGVLAERNGISPQYLEQAFAALRKAGIVKAIKGSQGGYQLNDEPKNIRVSQIIEALDGSYQLESEEIPEESHRRGIAASIQELIIDKVNIRLDEVLENTTLEDLKDNYLDHTEFSADMYYI